MNIRGFFQKMQKPYRLLTFEIYSVGFTLIDVTDVSTVEDIPELMSSSSLFSMLLPLILAYIGPVAASVPKVREFFFM